MSVTVKITPSQQALIARVGTKITVWDRDYEIHSVEGLDWYAFQSDDGMITVDLEFAPAPWLVVPRLTLIPVGSKIGEGVGREVDIDNPWVAQALGASVEA